MKIGFLISGIGIYGSVREIVESGNVFVDEGHDCIIFNPEGERIDWIEFRGQIKHERKLLEYKLDVLILTTTPNDKYFELFERAQAKMKIFCFMGFDPKFDIVKINPNLGKIFDKYFLAADGKWQTDWLKLNTKSKRIIFSQLGGINTQMFKPLSKVKHDKLNIGWSGDLRKRKGGETLFKYFEQRNIRTLTYFGKGIPQDKMKEWFNKIDIFVDNHYSGGWCNPVAEAMACKVPVICSDTFCNKSFAIDEKTALKFDYNDMSMMQSKLTRLINDDVLRMDIAENAYNWILQFNYEIISRRFLNEIESLYRKL